MAAIVAPPSSSSTFPPSSSSSPSNGPSHPSPSTSIPSSTTLPLPLLPTDLKEYILRFCDPSTLAVTSSLSLEFLELSSPLLYDDIIITGFDVMARLLCPRDSSHQPQLEPYLSLRRIRCLTFTPSPTDNPTSITAFSRDRSPNPFGVVEIDSLTLRFLSPTRTRILTHKAWMYLTPHLDPRRVYLTSDHHPLSKSRIPSVDILHARWNNLSLLEFRDLEATEILDWRCLRKGSKEVIVRLGSNRTGRPIGTYFAYWTARSSLGLARVKKVVVCLPTEEQSRYLRRRVDKLLAERVASEDDRARMQALVSFEIGLPHLPLFDAVNC